MADLTLEELERRLEAGKKLLELKRELTAEEEKTASFLEAGALGSLSGPGSACAASAAQTRPPAVPPAAARSPDDFATATASRKQVAGNKSQRNVNAGM